MAFRVGEYEFREGIASFAECGGPKGCGAAVSNPAAHAAWHTRLVDQFGDLAVKVLAAAREEVAAGVVPRPKAPVAATVQVGS